VARHVRLTDIELGFVMGAQLGVIEAGLDAYAQRNTRGSENGDSGDVSGHPPAPWSNWRITLLGGRRGCGLFDHQFGTAAALTGLQCLGITQTGQ